jgi:hypothetical protein
MAMKEIALTQDQLILLDQKRYRQVAKSSGLHRLPAPYPDWHPKYENSFGVVHSYVNLGKGCGKCGTEVAFNYLEHLGCIGCGATVTSLGTEIKKVDLSKTFENVKPKLDTTKKTAATKKKVEAKDADAKKGN